MSNQNWQAKNLIQRKLLKEMKKWEKTKIVREMMVWEVGLEERVEHGCNILWHFLAPTQRLIEWMLLLLMLMSRLMVMLLLQVPVQSLAPSRHWRLGVSMAHNGSTLTSSPSHWLHKREWIALVLIYLSTAPHCHFASCHLFCASLVSPLNWSMSAHLAVAHCIAALKIVATLLATQHNFQNVRTINNTNASSFAYSAQWICNSKLNLNQNFVNFASLNLISLFTSFSF